MRLLGTNEFAGETKEEKSEVKFSSKYLLGTYFGGDSWGYIFNCLQGKVILCTNGELLVYMPVIDKYHNIKEYKHVETIRLDREEYYNIERCIDRELLYVLDPEEDLTVDDGMEDYLILYGQDDKPLKECGGFEPDSKVFNAMRTVLLDHIPMKELLEIRAQWMKNSKENSDEEELNNQ